MATTSNIAYGVYNYGLTTPEGQVGRADYDGSSNTISHTVANITSLSPDPKAFWFENVAGAGRLLVAETQYDADYNPLPSQFSVYDASDNGAKPPTFTKVWPSGKSATFSDLINVYSIATKVIDDVNYIYGIDYDLHKVFRIANASGDNYAYDNQAGYIYTDASTQKYGVDLAIVGEFVYALFIRGDNVYGGSYDPSAIVKLPLSLDPFGAGAARNNTDLAENAVDLKPSGNSLIYVPSVGGAQRYGNYNTGSKLQSVTLANLSVKNLLINAASGAAGAVDTTDFRDISVGQNNGEVFILKGILDSAGAGFYGFLFRTTVGTLNAITPTAGVTISSLALPQLAIGSAGTPIPGYVWALLYDDADGKTWMAEGNDLSVYSFDGSDVVQDATITISALATAAYSLNAVTIYGQAVQLRGAQHPTQASNSPQANAAKASAAAGEEDEK